MPSWGGSSPRPGSIRANKNAVERAGQESLFDPEPQRGRPPGRAPKRDRPAGYENAMVWAMAERFERLAYDNRVYLGGKGAPYIYKALARPVAVAGIQRRRYLTGRAGVYIHGADLGIRIVNYFWKHAAWDEGGDTISLFADPLMLEECLAGLKGYWRARRAATRLDAKPYHTGPFNREDTV